MTGQLGPGSRRALPVPAVIVADPEQRLAALQEAIDDPDRLWVLQEFDGRVFVSRDTVRGPAARSAFLLDGGDCQA